MTRTKIIAELIRELCAAHSEHLLDDMLRTGFKGFDTMDEEELMEHYYYLVGPHQLDLITDSTPPSVMPWWADDDMWPSTVLGEPRGPRAVSHSAPLRKQLTCPKARK